jgi:hypothetical protein
MRNFKSLPLLSLAILCSGALAGCGGSNSATFTISFDSQGGSAVSALTVAAGAVASKPADPTYEGHSFEGWFKDSYCTSAFDWASKITIDWTLYAGWSGGSSSTSSSSGGSSSTSTATSESGGTTSTSVAAAGTYYLDFSAVTWWADASAILNAHYWCATESENTTWPGTVMAKVSDTVYSIVNVPSDVSGFVFNRQNPDSTAQAASDKGVWNQSIDAAVEAGKNCFVLSTEQDKSTATTKQKGSWSVYGA